MNKKDVQVLQSIKEKSVQNRCGPATVMGSSLTKLPLGLLTWEGVSAMMILSQENYLKVEGKTLRETRERDNLLLSSNRIPVRPPASWEVFVILYVEEEIV